MIASVILLVCCLATNVASMWIKEMENPGLYEGDMIMTPKQMEEIKKGIFQFAARTDKYMWPNAVVPYELESSLESNKDFMSEFNVAISEYEKYTCLRFVKKTTQRGYISFYQGGGCSSAVGHRGTRNRVSLSSGCWWRAVIMHEIGHSLGMYHEQSRPDRDQHVKVLFQNISPGMDYNFKKQEQKDINSRNTPYDYRSMMHYSWNAFGGDKMTIQTLDPKQQYEIGQRDGFSHLDILQLQRMYNCKGNYPTLKPYVRPPTGCYDTGYGCARHAFKGDCNVQTWKRYLSTKCRRSCGLCGDSTGTGRPVTYPPYTRPTAKVTTSIGTTKGNGNCVDQSINCADFLSYCKNTSKVWIDFMKKRCRKTCNHC